MAGGADPTGRGERFLGLVVGLAIGSMIGIGLVIAAAVFYSILALVVPGFHGGISDSLFAVGFGLPALAGASYGWQRGGRTVGGGGGGAAATGTTPATRRRADVLLGAALLLLALPFLLLLLRRALH